MNRANAQVKTFTSEAALAEYIKSLPKPIRSLALSTAPKEIQKLIKKRKRHPKHSKLR